MTRTAESIHETAKLQEAMTRSLRPITLEIQNDDGTWTERLYADEKTAIWEEQRFAKRGVPTRRKEA